MLIGAIPVERTIAIGAKGAGVDENWSNRREPLTATGGPTKSPADDEGPGVDNLWFKPRVITSTDIPKEEGPGVDNLWFKPRLIVSVGLPKDNEPSVDALWK